MTSRQAGAVALVLAADRHSPDPVAVHTGVACKALAPVAGRPMILHVLDALQASAHVASVVLSGPPRPAIETCPELKARIDAGDVNWIANLDSPSLSAAAALEQIRPEAPVLLTTADHALLRADIVDFFLEHALARDADAAVGIVEGAHLRGLFPDSRRTFYRFSEGEYRSCNLFALLSAEGRRLAGEWRRVEMQRKHAARMLGGLLGYDAALLYLLGRLSLRDTLARLSVALRARIEAVKLPFAEAGIDVDTPADLAMVRGYHESMVRRSAAD